MSTRVLFWYQPPIEAFVVALKFEGALHYANWFAKKMLMQWKMPEVDCIIPVPLHPMRQRERGFNQTWEIAKIIVKKTGVPGDPWSATRHWHRPSQSQLSAAQRKRNVIPAMFTVSKALRNKRVLVVEDVITTGTTIRAFTEALHQAGVRSVTVWACAQAHGSNHTAII